MKQLQTRDRWNGGVILILLSFRRVFVEIISLRNIWLKMKTRITILCCSTSYFKIKRRGPWKNERSFTNLIGTASDHINWLEWKQCRNSWSGQWLNICIWFQRYFFIRMKFYLYWGSYQVTLIVVIHHQIIAFYVKIVPSLRYLIFFALHNISSLK